MRASARASARALGSEARIEADLEDAEGTLSAPRDLTPNPIANEFAGRGTYRTRRIPWCAGATPNQLFVG
eukprot:2534573-Pyramimonas_sp.AAC.1